MGVVVVANKEVEVVDDAITEDEELSERETVEVDEGSGDDDDDESAPTHTLFPQVWPGLHALQSSPTEH